MTPPWTTAQFVSGTVIRNPYVILRDAKGRVVCELEPRAVGFHANRDALTRALQEQLSMGDGNDQ